MTIRSGTSSEGNVYFSDGTSGDAEYKGIVKYDHSSDEMSFWSNAVRRITIASSGIGIGTDAPAHNVEIVAANAGSVNDSLQIRNDATSSGTGSRIRFINSTDKNSDANGASIASVRNGNDNDLVFETENSEAMRILSNGAITHGDTTQIENCLYNQHFAPATFAGIGMKPTSFVGYDAMRFNNSNGTRVGTINCQTNGTSYATTSDYRVKENVADMTGAIDRVKALAPKRFNFITDPEDTTVDGFLAHEAQAVVPEAVTGTHNEVETWTQQEIDDGDAPDGTSAGDNKLDGDGNTIPVMQGIDQSKLVPLLTGALKEAITKIEDLETRLAALEGA
jgi:hypothetical protein